MPSLILLCESIVQATTVKPAELNSNLSEATKAGKRVRFEEGTVENKDVLEWNILSGIHSIIMQIIKKQVNNMLFLNAAQVWHRVFINK